ncbi:pregnancy-specific beta-1-glycoprotein 5-like [Dendropsophus ebraccatus]|uniref:pregnancy-specific beta-1-glycoprotein 5-like n=1 Tax=Dendropsophus ebraccatus TaxID=150705 RepID=UPI003831F6B1
MPIVYMYGGSRDIAVDYISMLNRQLSNVYGGSVLLSLRWDEISGNFTVVQFPTYPFTGGSVTLKVPGITEKTTSVTWYKGPDTSEENHILTYFPGNGTNISAPLYNSKVTSLPNGSLQISDLQIVDSGNYSVIVYNTSEIAEQGFVSLIVYNSVPYPNLTASGLTPKENDNLTLFCQAENYTLLSFMGPGIKFLNGSARLKGISNLTLPRVTRKYTGYYYCEAKAPPVSFMSNILYIEVAYGPVNAEIRGKLTVNYGSRLLLICTAESFPLAAFQWKHNNKHLKTQNTNRLRIDYVTLSDRGAYTCEARNSITKINSTDTVTVDVSAATLIGVTTTCVIIVIIIGALLLIRKYMFPKMGLDCGPSAEDSDNEAEKQDSVPGDTQDNAEDQQEE